MAITYANLFLTVLPVFLLIGAGINTTQTAGLALATDVVAEDKRPRVIALMYLMMLLGTLVSAVVPPIAPSKVVAPVVFLPHTHASHARRAARGKRCSPDGGDRGADTTTLDSRRRCAQARRRGSARARHRGLFLQA